MVLCGLNFSRPHCFLNIGIQRRKNVYILGTSHGLLALALHGFCMVYSTEFMHGIFCDGIAVCPFDNFLADNSTICLVDMS